MSTMIWIIIFCISALLFFCTAAVIIIVGAGDLRDLLNSKS